MSIINCVGKRIKRTVALLIAATLLCSLTGCAKGPTGNNNLSSDIDSNNADETEFDIERVRKSFIIKGVPFELPKRIGDLDDAWTYQKRETHYVDDTGLADFYFNGK